MPAVRIFGRPPADNERRSRTALIGDHRAKALDNANHSLNDLTAHRLTASKSESLGGGLRGIRRSTVRPWPAPSSTPPDCGGPGYPPVVRERGPQASEKPP